MKYYYVISEDLLMAIIRTEDNVVMEHSGKWATLEDVENYFARMTKLFEENPEEYVPEEYAGV